MPKTIITISSLLLSIAILLMGNGLFTTLLTLRGALEGYSAGIIGIIMAMYFIGFIAGTFFCPKIIRRVGHIRTFTVMAAVASCTVIVHGLYTNPYIWSFMRFVSGVCLVGIYMVIESWLNEQSSNQNRGMILATYMLVMLVALAAGQFLIIAADIGDLTLFAMAAGFFSMGLVPVALTRLPEPVLKSAIDTRIKQTFKISELGFSGSMVAGILVGAFWSIGPLYALRIGLSTGDIAIFMSAAILGGALLQYPIGICSDRYNRRIILVGISILSSIIALITIFVPPQHPYMMAACMFVYGGMMFSIYPVSIAHANDHPQSDDYISTSSNLLLVYGIGAVIGPVAGGLSMQFFGRYSLLFMFMIIGTGLAVFALYWNRHGKEISREDKTTFVPIVRTSPVVLIDIADND